MIDYRSTLRGSGPAPPGYHRCWNTQCPKRRQPDSGRFGKAGAHYHPIVVTDEERVRVVALNYLMRSDVRVVGHVLRGREALVLVRARRGDFSLHLVLSDRLGWQVTDELDAIDYYRNGGVGPTTGA